MRNTPRYPPTSFSTQQGSVGQPNLSFIGSEHWAVASWHWHLTNELALNLETAIHFLKCLSSPGFECISKNIWWKLSLKKDENKTTNKYTVRQGTVSKPGTNLLFSPPGLLGRASISIGAQAAAATGLTTGMADQAPLLGATCWGEEWEKIHVNECKIVQSQQCNIWSCSCHPTLLRELHPVTCLNLLSFVCLSDVERISVCTAGLLLTLVSLVELTPLPDERTLWKERKWSNEQKPWKNS